MAELESLMTQVWNADARPFVDEAWRCYGSGALRASIAATWTAITTDIITKLVYLADEGDAAAVDFRTSVTRAQEQGISPNGVRAMQDIEAKVLEKAQQFELVDAIGRRELERIREDRNLCVHPSLRVYGEAFEPHPEVTRGHLAVALSTLLVHPPAQGARILNAFISYTCDPSFVAALSHIQATFFDRVRTNARKNLASLAAKHALRELDPDGRLSPLEYANRCAVVLRAFAERDRALVSSAVVAQREPFQQIDGQAQVRALIRMGDQDYFWDMVDGPLAERLDGLLTIPTDLAPWDPLPSDLAVQFTILRSEQARRHLPRLATGFTTLGTLQQMSVAELAQSHFFVPTAVGAVKEAWSYRVGEQAGRILLQHATFLRVDDLRTALQAWAENGQCREAADMPELAVSLFYATRHLGPQQSEIFGNFLALVKDANSSGNDHYEYRGLEQALASGRSVA